MEIVRWVGYVLLLVLLQADASHVIVIGGGFSGLGAATQLEADGHDVTVLEARSRLGGRAFTDTTTFDHPVDMGAMWIHGITSNAIYELAQKYNISTKHTDYDNLKLFGPTGTAIDDQALESQYDKLTKEVDKLRNAADKDESLGAAMEKAFKKMGLSKEEQDLMRFKICDEIELDYSASIYNLSGYWFDDDDNLKGGDVLITDPQGYHGIVAPVAAALKDVRLNATVQRIEYTSSGVKVHSSVGDLSADYVVVTASLGTLKRDLITFSPALPSDIVNAIQRLGCDVSDKVVLQFPKGSSSTWGGDALDVFYHLGEETTHHGEFTENWNLHHYSGKDMLMSFSVGARDWALVESDPDNSQVGAKAAAALRTAYPKLPEPTVVGVHRWGEDPLASCSWSSWYVGSTPKDTKAFLKGAGSGRVLFAGEHTTKHHPGTTHGAWATGLSAAKAVGAHSRLGVADRELLAELRTKHHTPAPEDVLERRPLRSKRKEWLRQSKQKLLV